MNRRTGWMIGGAIAAVVLVGAVLWIWQGTSAPPPVVTPTPTPSASTPAPASERAQDELDAVLTACAESTARTPPEHCGIRIPWGTEFAEVTGIRYRIEKMPTLILDDDSFAADGGALVATVSGTGQDGTARTETYRTENWAVRGEVEISDDRIELSVW